MSFGFRILPAAPQMDTPLRRAFEDVSTSAISDVMNRMCGVVGLHKYDSGAKMVGTAFTVRTRPGDNLMVHKALQLVRRGDVLVVDGGGTIDRALIGELMMLEARASGVAGFVVEGAIRDVGAYRSNDFPCYARGHNHLGPYKDGPGEINVPVAIGGLVIRPGDIVIGDDDGIVAFSPEHAPGILAEAVEKGRAEEKTRMRIAEGTFTKPWIDEALGAKGLHDVVA